MYLLRYEFNRIPDNGYPYIWVMFLMAHVVVSIALHAISLYLVVLMAFIRVRSIQARSSRWLKTGLARSALLHYSFLIFIHRISSYIEDIILKLFIPFLIDAHLFQNSCGLYFFFYFRIMHTYFFGARNPWTKWQ